jgi:hypothetical protein
MCYVHTDHNSKAMLLIKIHSSYLKIPYAIYTLKQLVIYDTCLRSKDKIKKPLWLSPQANYTDWSTAADRRT